MGYFTLMIGVYNGFRGYLAYKVGCFIPVLLEADKVLVGRDARLSSPEIFEYVAKASTMPVRMFTTLA